jgi:hypothetical protein
MKTTILSLIACVALASCEDNSVSYEQVLVNHTNEIITVMGGSGTCGEQNYTISPGQKKTVHQARVLNAPSSCADHHYMIMSGPNNITDISDQSNWIRTESKGIVRCEFDFEYTHNTDTTAVK